MNDQVEPARVVETFGQRLECRMIDVLALEPVTEFGHLLDLKNLAGESTGYVRTLSTDRIDRATSVSIGIGPEMRYFNIHIIPDHRYDIPRFSFEGMLGTNRSQASIDLYPDFGINALTREYRARTAHASHCAIELPFLNQLN